MGNTNHESLAEEKKSNSSVLDLSLNLKKRSNSKSLMEKDHDEIIQDIKNQKDFIIETDDETRELPESEFMLSDIEVGLKMNNFLLKMDEMIDKDRKKDTIIIINEPQTKTDVQILQNSKVKKTPRPRPLISNEYISPLKLSIKSYGNTCQRYSNNLNAVLYDYQKDKIDCKSFNDEDFYDFDDYEFLLETETERTTPNVEDLQNLFECRKKMIIFRKSINTTNVNEYENILNSDYMFEKELNNNRQSKKSSYWVKHIKQQILKEKNKTSNIHSSRLKSESFAKNKDNDINKEHGLFILGILESAANERKGRYTVKKKRKVYNKL